MDLKPMEATSETLAVAKRGTSVAQLYKTKFEMWPFEGEWLSSFGMPEKNKMWYIQAGVNCGKTTGVCMIAKYFSQHGKVAYMPTEEGKSASLREAFKRVNITAKHRVTIYTEDIEEFSVRLRKHKSPDIIIIDTIQYWGVERPKFRNFIKEFSHKQIIVVGHMEGNKPEGRLGVMCRQLGFVKINIVGFMMFISSRFGGGKPMVIWQEGADKFGHDL